MTDLEVVPTERCAAFADPFDLIGPCQEEGIHFHMGVKWCQKHLDQVKAAELRALALSNRSKI